MYLEQSRTSSGVKKAFAWLNAHALHVILGIYCVAGLTFALFGNSNRDEGWYLYASRLVYEGEIPYKDFPYFQMPLLPYIYGLPQLLFGPSLLVGRLTSFAFSLITVGVGLRLAQRMAGRTAALLFLALTFLNLDAMWTYTTTRTEPLVTPLVMLSLFFLLKERRSTTDLVLAPSLLLWATAVRLTAAPAFVAVLAFCLYQARKNRNQWDAILIWTGLQVVLLVVVPLLLTQDKFVFNVWTSQVFRGGQLGETQAPLGAMLRDKALFFSTFYAGYPLTAILSLGAALYLAVLWRGGWRPSIAKLGEYPTANLGMLALAGLTFLPHLAISTIAQVYFITAFAILTLMASITVVKAASAVPRTGALGVSFVVGGLLLFGTLSIAHDFPGAINTVYPSLHEYSQMGDYLNAVVPPDKQILTFDVSVAIAANRDVAPGLEMSDVSYWPVLRTDRAKHYGVVDYELLQEIAADKKTAAIVIGAWDPGLIMRGMTSPPAVVTDDRAEAVLALFPRSADEYRLARVFPGHGHWGGDYLVFLRND